MTAINKVWHLTATDLTEKTIKSSVGTRSVYIRNTEKRMFFSRKVMIDYMKQHASRYNMRVTKKSNLCIYDLYQILEIDTDMCPRYEEMFLEKTRLQK